jgi:hypothetical protein
MSDAREHELCVLQRRVAQLEDTGGGDHWLMIIHSVFAAIARVLMMGRLSSEEEEEARGNNNLNEQVEDDLYTH